MKIKEKRERKMKNIKKILPAVALAGAGIITLVGAGNASAYDYYQQLGTEGGVATLNPGNVKICYELNNIITTTQTTFTVYLTSDGSIDMTKVTNLTSDDSIDMTEVTTNATFNDTTYTATSSTAGNFTIGFNENGTVSTVVKCAHLDFSQALEPDSAFDTYTVEVSNVTSSNPSVPADDESGKAIEFGYQLRIDPTTQEPLTTSGGRYMAEYWTKDFPTLESEIPLQYGHIVVNNKVRGNAADPTAAFTYKVLADHNTPLLGDSYNIYIEGAVTTCDYGTDCEFTLEHGKTALIGCSNSSCTNDGQFIQGAVDYKITETGRQGHTTYIDGVQGYATGDLTVNATAVTHNFVNEKTNTISGHFFNILPFIVLAILTSVGVVTLRKSGKKNEA